MTERLLRFAFLLYRFVLANDGLVQIRTGTGNVAEIRFYCEVSNAHYQTLKADLLKLVGLNLMMETLPFLAMSLNIAIFQVKSRNNIGDINV